MHKSDEKRLIAQYHAWHDFLVRDGANPETDPRETVASVLVTPGTTLNVVVDEALKWIHTREQTDQFEITWYTPGALVPATLRSFRLTNPDCSAAAQVFLFPGRVDHETEAVCGPEAVEFARGLQRYFTCAFHTCHAFDMTTGSLLFHFSEEVELQKACAGRYASRKFLFLDSSKFQIEGYPGFSVTEMLRASRSVTIYTVASEKDSWLKAAFESLAASLIGPGERDHNLVDQQLNFKSLRLRIVGAEGAPSHCIEKSGYLRLGGP